MDFIYVALHGESIFDDNTCSKADHTGLLSIVCMKFHLNARVLTNPLDVPTRQC